MKPDEEWEKEREAAVAEAVAKVGSMGLSVAATKACRKGGDCCIMILGYHTVPDGMPAVEHRVHTPGLRVCSWRWPGSLRGAGQAVAPLCSRC